MTFDYAGLFDGSDPIGPNRSGPSKYHMTVWMRRGDYRTGFKMHRDDRAELSRWAEFPIGKQMRFAYTVEADGGTGPDGLPWRNI